MHAYERDLHLILTSQPWSLSGSAVMETITRINRGGDSALAARLRALSLTVHVPAAVVGRSRAKLFRCQLSISERGA
jgi:hypothetical protein